METRELHFERFEAVISSWENTKRLVRVPLQGSVTLSFYGNLTVQLDDDCEPQFIITRADTPSPALVFYAKDVEKVMNPDSKEPQIVLKPAVVNESKF